MLRPEFLVSTSPEEGQGNSDLAADGTGRIVAVWSSSLQDGAGQGVFAKRLSPGGSPLSDEFQVNSFTTGGQATPAVAADATGNFVVVWTSSGQDGSGSGVFGQRFDADGLPVSGEFQVTTTTAGDQSSPKVAMNAQGTFVVVWESAGQDGSLGGIFGQRFAASGAPAGEEFQVHDFTTGWQSQADLAIGPDGEFLVVWASQDQDGSGLGVYGRRFQADGTPVAAEFPVNSSTAGHQEFPTVALDGFGGWLVTWSSSPAPEENWQILGQRYAASGLAIGDEFAVSVEGGYSHINSSVVADGSGTYFVGWTAIVPNPLPLQDAFHLAYGRRFDAAGNPLESEFEISENAAQTGGTRVVANGPQGFAASWHTYGGYLNLTMLDVFAKIYAVPYFGDGFESGDTCVWSATVGGGACP